MSAQVEALRTRYAALREAGVEDIKFVFAPLSEATLDDVCSSVNEVLDAIARRDYVESPVTRERRDLIWFSSAHTFACATSSR